ncbi:MAG: GGDEF domain-containing protein, partial [Acidimicrobiales bacterium]
GLLGCGLAIAGALTGSPVMAVIAAVFALMAGAWSLSLLDNARGAELRADKAVTELALLRELELASTPSYSIVDAETGLPDNRWFEVTVEHRVNAARRHLWPVTVVLLDIAVTEGPRRVDQLVGFCNLLQDTLREADAICRVAPNTFALILEDTNEAGGVWAAERLQVAVARDRLADGLAAGVATYPSHGMSAPDLLSQARNALRRATTASAGFGLGHVEVATTEVAGN